jgi:hypothetical protein
MLQFIGTNSPVAVEPEWEKIWRLAHIVALAAELGENELKDATIAELRELTKDHAQPHEIDWYAAVDDVCRAFSDEADDKLDAAFLKQFDERLSRTEKYNQANYYYFMGAALDARGRTEEAESYWRRAAFGGPYEKFNVTLAGHRLASRYGPERGGMPPELIEVEAKIKAAREAAGLETTPEAEDPDAPATAGEDAIE